MRGGRSLGNLELHVSSVELSKSLTTGSTGRVSSKGASGFSSVVKLINSSIGEVFNDVTGELILSFGL